MRIVWSASLETGIRSIDLQHEELIDMLNELDAALDANRSQTMLDEILQRLGAYVTFHFGTEEAMIAGLRGADAHIEAHLQQHRSFVERIAAMREKAKSDGMQAMEELAVYLNEWLYEHILKTDRHLGALLTEQNSRA